jgi:hypothetical protein
MELSPRPCTSAQAAERERHQGQAVVQQNIRAESVDRPRPDVSSKIREKRAYALQKRQHVERLRNMDQALMSHENTAAFLEDSREVHPEDQHHNHKGVRIIENSLFILE